MINFVAHDFCGWAENYGRFTVVSQSTDTNGNTLVCRSGMNQAQWDRAQLNWFSQLDQTLVVYKCLRGPYAPNDSPMGTVKEICDRLKLRLGE